MVQEENSSHPRQTGRRANRARRAEALRKDALSPIRILKRLVLVPVVAAGIALSAYIRTSDYGSEDALRHLVAMVGCGPAAAMGLAPAQEGELGYHPRNDPEGDGVACGTETRFPAPEQDNRVRSVGGAKFVRP
ncbi:excalibur calcium-binding domain-containing protein [Actibacterium lipolyticum]|uniref:Excalibur calcium-binding domain-containing protein n=1 Tax=Actibacterium lipolyticum TaxID=1524263 RepID=A0A238JLN4_9RHOB|nr:excalibur calcium-binding domain-containing protein [Actibacterium lipolyticum]SMX31561.1 hypothetical protein COL8621_00511 [Actibacterium lipolyticum]